MDSYHAALTQIARTLKRQPGSLTLENVLRLINFYKFEIFIEDTSTNNKRISIGGKVLAADIDLHLVAASVAIKGQTRIRVDKAKVVLPDKNATQDFIWMPDVLSNAMSLDKLTQFDRCLEQLSVLDQNSVIEENKDKIDLFQTYVSMVEHLKVGFAVVVSDDEFSVLVGGKYRVCIASDERVSLSLGTTTQIVNDTCFKLEAVEPMALPRHLISQNGLVMDDGHTVLLSNNNDVYRTPQGTMLQIFQFVRSEIVQSTTVLCGSLPQLLEAVHWLVRYDALFQMTRELQRSMVLMDRFSEVTHETQLFAEFAAHAGSKHTGDQHFVKVVVTDDELSVQSDVGYNEQVALAELTAEKASAIAQRLCSL